MEENYTQGTRDTENSGDVRKGSDASAKADKAVKKGEEFDVILKLLDDAKTELGKKLDKDPESEKCQIALDHVNQAYDELKSYDAENIEEDVAGMKGLTGDFMSGIMNSEQA